MIEPVDRRIRDARSMREEAVRARERARAVLADDKARRERMRTARDGLICPVLELENLLEPEAGS